MSQVDFLPQQLSYLGPRLRGQATTFQQWVIYPLSSNQFWQTNSIVKIASNINTGLVDWYRSHIQLTVQVPMSLCPVGGMQIDNSAFGAINQMVITHQGYQVQRLMQYDTILAYLVDVGFSQWVCQSRQSQGLGYTNVQTQAPIANTQRRFSNKISNWIQAANGQPVNNALSYQQTFSNGYSPTLTPVMPGIYKTRLNTTAPFNGCNITASRSFQGGDSSTHQDFSNFALVNNNNAASSFPQAKIITDNYQRGPNLRAQYKYYINKNQYPDSPDSDTLINPRVKNQTWNFATWQMSGYNPNNPYQIDFGLAGNSMQQDLINVGGAANTMPYYQQPCGVSGYAKPLCPQFCTGGFQPMLSPTIPQCQMSYGVIQNTPIPISKRRYRMPLASTLCGVLIPPDQFRLFPAAFYQNLILQLTLNPYWMFATGLSDVHQFDQTGINTPIKRKWYYSQINWTWHIYTMNNQQLMQRVQAQLYKPIQFSSKYWQLLSQYQLPTGSYVKQTNQIPCNMESLAQIVIIFLSNQYLKYTFCRKQFRLSNNITQMQLRANTIYYPIQPIVGNAGNPQMIDQTGDNWPFYQLLLLSNNFLFNTNIPAPKINKKNFAINSRIYDTSNKKTLYNPNNAHYTGSGWSVTDVTDININNVNCDTALGQSWFHQNRYIGKAAFTYSFEPYGHSRTLINGVNTLGWKQFQVTFNNSTVNQFPGDQTQYIFGQANVLVKLQMGRAIKVLGI